MTIKKISEIQNLKYLKEEYINLSYFFKNNNDNTLIGASTSFCFNTSKKFIEMVEPYLLKCERDIIIFMKIIFYELIPQINIENYYDYLEKITRYIISFSSFCPKNSCFWKIFNEKFETNNIAENKKEIQIEISNLHKITNVDKKYFQYFFI